MTTKVIFAFDQDAGGITNFFELDGAVKGKLDNTTYTLGGAFSLVDVTSDVRSLTINRGRSRLLDKIESATAEILLDNRARLYDPLTGGGESFPYASSIVPRKNVQVTVNDRPVFSGLVDAWDIDYEINEDSTSRAVCADGFITLAETDVSTSAKTAQTSGARIEALLTEAGWPSSKRDIATGQVTLQADTPDADTNLLEYASRVKSTEFGSLFMSREGLATFQDRQETQNFGTFTVLGSGGIPISAVQIENGTDDLHNVIRLQRVGGSEVERSDATSKTTFGISELTASKLLFDDDVEVADLADYLLARFKDATFSINQVVIVMDGLSEAQQNTVAELEINSPVQVSFAPAVGPAVTQFATIDRIAHAFVPGEHVVTFSMSEAKPSFILNDTTFGELDDDRLGF
jgi:hypothetical protein